MNSRKNFIALLLMMALLLGGAYLLYRQLTGIVDPQQLASEQEQQEQQAQSVPAPDFTVYSAGGEPVQLSDFEGKPVVLNFWASWCGPCQSEMPEFEEVYLQLGDQVQFLMINVTDGSRETQESAGGFIARQGYSFPVYYDTSLSAASAYGAYALPTTYFIDREGFAVAKATGAIDSDTLAAGIEMILPED